MNITATLRKAALLAATLLGACAAPAAWCAATLTMSTEYPATSMSGLGISTFADLVKQKTKGQVVIDASYDAAKGIKSGGMIEAVQTRKIDAGDAFAGALATQYPIFGVSSLPFLADSVKKAQALTQASRPAYEKLLAAHGQKLLYTTPWPASGIWSKQPVKSVTDLRSLTIRTYDDTSQQVMTKAGAKGVNISFADAMPRIVSGEVNAVLSSGDGGAGRKLWDYLPYFAEINYAMPISVATMNLDAYKALDAASRKAIDQAAAQTEREQWTRIQGRLKENYANMRKNGVKIDARVPDEVKKALQAASASALDDWKKATGAEGGALLKRYRKR